MSDLPSPVVRPRHSELQKAKKRSKRKRVLSPAQTKRRRRRKIVIGLASVVGVVIIFAGAAFGYAWWRYREIPKVNIAGLTPRPASGAFNILLVGSDSRAFAGDSGENAATYGSASSVGGQRSDVIIIARIDPTTHSVRLLSIPRDTWVNIPGHVANVSGANRINAAYNSGPQLLIETIKDTFHLPISDYVDINFQGLQNIVNAVGGVYLDFRDPVYDTDSHLGISKTGCHLVFGSQALALVRSRHLYYKTDGTWNYDGLSDWSRIQRQDAFFRALLPRMKSIATNPAALNSLLSAAAKNITIDRTLSEGELISLVGTFKDINDSEFVTQTLPTAPETINGQQVVIPAPAQDDAVLSKFLAFGSTTTTAYSPPSTSQHQGATALLTSAKIVAGPDISVKNVPGIAAPNPADVVNNTQQEPWNPTPCQPAN